ncbi:hypothetical protein B0T20DRAFT_492129 [Sordaria brevicollis]|uniref:Uncharacterized protein n=1 Tax=Sordaria brevicollis TaxID=83679 RepID=A0AAE0PK15_SORBR|nr:hypothetical protein B0T20DRAFT_492129 [Sordaria brevicollis]
MARPKKEIRISPREVLQSTPWPTSTIWKAEDLPAQLTPENCPGIVYSLKEVRVTPWGLQGRYDCPGQDSKRDDRGIWLPTLFPDLQESGSGIPGIHVEDIVRGRWIQNREYRSRNGPWGVPLAGWRPPIRRQGSPPESLPLPQDYVMQAFSLDYEDAVSKAVDMDVIDDVPDSAFKPGQGGGGMLDKLPVELMKEIVSYLVPTSCTYSFFVADRRDIYPESYSACSVVHQMAPIGRRQRSQEGREDIDWTDDTDSHSSDGEVPKEPRHKGSAHMALASINRTFQELIYARFYGGNTFIFHLSVSPLTRVDLEAPYHGTRWLSWSRILTRNVLPPGPLGPITASAARYMRDVKLSVVTPSDNTSDIEAMASLGKVVASAVNLLLPKDEQTKEQQGQIQPYISLHLQFSTPTEDDYTLIEALASGQSVIPRFQPNVVTMQAGFNLSTAKMDTGPGTWSAFEGYELKQPPSIENKLDLALQPLRKLKGLVKDMWAHGYDDIPADFLDDIGLVQVQKAERLPTCYTPHYSNTCRCTENGGARVCPQRLPKSGVPTLRWQLEAMGWSFYRARDHAMEEGLKGGDAVNSDATSATQTATVESPRPRRNFFVPFQFGVGSWEP